LTSGFSIGIPARTACSLQLTTRGSDHTPCFKRYMRRLTILFLVIVFYYLRLFIFIVLPLDSSMTKQLNSGLLPAQCIFVLQRHCSTEISDHQVACACAHK